MKKMFVCLVSFFCLTASVMAYKYSDDPAAMAKMTTTQIRLAILERYANAEDLKALIDKAATSDNARLISRVTLATQQVFTSKAAVSAADREKAAEYALEVIPENGKAFTAADGSYRFVLVPGTTPNYDDDDDYKPVSASATEKAL